MKFFRDSWRESFFILAVVVIAVKICTLLLVHKNISGSLFDSLVGGIISAGIIGFIVAFVVYIIQQRSDLLNKKQTATAFYETRFLPDIRELFSRNVSPWNVNGANKFYFDNSYTNSIYDLYEKYTEAIFEYHKIFPRNRIVNCIKLIYRKAREGYVLGEKIDQFLGNRIRLQLAPLNIEDHMDKYLLRYLKAR